MPRKPQYGYARRERERGRAAKKEAKREAQRAAVERRRAETDDGEPAATDDADGSNDAPAAG